MEFFQSESAVSLEDFIQTPPPDLMTPGFMRGIGLLNTQGCALSPITVTEISDADSLFSERLKCAEVECIKHSSQVRLKIFG